MKDKLLAYGWKMYYSCFCGGVYKEYYNSLANPGYKIIAKPKKKRFISKKNNSTVKDDHDYLIEDYLKTLL